MSLDQKIAELEQALEQHKANFHQANGALVFAKQLKAEQEAEKKEEKKSGKK